MYESWLADPHGRNGFGVAPKTNGYFAWVALEIAETELEILLEREGLTL